MLFSNITNEENKFRAFSFKSTGVPSLDFNTVMKELKLDVKANKDIFAELFGIGSQISDTCNYLAKEVSKGGKYELKFEVGKDVVEESKAIVGWGIKQQKVPQATMFGKNILLLNKFYH